MGKDYYENMLKICVILFVLSLSFSKGVATGIEDIVSKFQQNDYKLAFEWGEAVRYNKEQLKYFHVIVFKYNRTTTAGNMTIEYNFNISKDLELIIQAYKFASNEFRLFPLRFQVNFCYAVEQNLVGAQRSFKCGNVHRNTRCPLIKDKRYHVCNWVPDENLFPPFIPNGKYMLEIQGLYQSTEMFLVRGYGSVSRPIAWE